VMVTLHHASSSVPHNDVPIAAASVMQATKAKGTQTATMTAARNARTTNGDRRGVVPGVTHSPVPPVLHQAELLRPVTVRS
jgi:hypothetical protein